MRIITLWLKRDLQVFQCPTQILLGLLDPRQSVKVKKFILLGSKIDVVALIQISNVDRKKPDINQLKIWQFLPSSKLIMNMVWVPHFRCSQWCHWPDCFELSWRSELWSRGDFAEVILSRASFLRDRRSRVNASGFFGGQKGERWTCSLSDEDIPGLLGLCRLKLFLLMKLLLSDGFKYKFSAGERT